MTTTTASPVPFGALLRQWRAHRRVSQLDLSGDADISTRHLSFIETGRSQPSREMVIRISEHLDVPLRDRNRMLLAAGFAPTYPERDLDAPEMASARTAVHEVLAAHQPYPALAVDRTWNVVGANAAVEVLTQVVSSTLHDELAAYPHDGSDDEARSTDPGSVYVPLLLRVGQVDLSFLAIIATFGTALDITLSELAIESFYPADAVTAAYLRERRN